MKNKYSNALIFTADQIKCRTTWQASKFYIYFIPNVPLILGYQHKNFDFFAFLGINAF